MPHCENCHLFLGSNRAILHHLEEVHNVHVRLGQTSHLAYCEDCHAYLGKKKGCFNSARAALEKHLLKKHAIDIQEAASSQEHYEE